MHLLVLMYIEYSNLRKLSLNLIPFPRVSDVDVTSDITPDALIYSYISSSHPMLPFSLSLQSSSSKIRSKSLQLRMWHSSNLIPDMNPVFVRLFDRKHALVAVDPRFGKYLTAAVIFRGDVGSKDVGHLCCYTSLILTFTLSLSLRLK